MSKANAFFSLFDVS
uniref:Uncharacterized protein n=1 Tax=Rhizophora mucronata TaxID=61149 RepID=A0A2P2IP97_RHIMU